MKSTYIDQIHLFLVIHVVHRETTLVDEVVKSWILLNQQFICAVIEAELKLEMININMNLTPLKA